MDFLEKTVLELPLSLEHDVTGIIDSPDVRSIAVLLSVDTPTHGSLTDDVQSTVGDQGEYIKLSPSTPWLQDLTQLLTVTVHHLKEILENPEVEGWGQKFPPGVPLLPGACQQASTKPGHQELL